MTQTGVTRSSHKTSAKLYQNTTSNALFASPSKTPFKILYNLNWTLVACFQPRALCFQSIKQQCNQYFITVNIILVPLPLTWLVKQQEESNINEIFSRAKYNWHLSLGIGLKVIQPQKNITSTWLFLPELFKPQTLWCLTYQRCFK